MRGINAIVVKKGNCLSPTFSLGTEGKYYVGRTYDRSDRPSWLKCKRMRRKFVHSPYKLRRKIIMKTPTSGGIVVENTDAVLWVYPRFEDIKFYLVRLAEGQYYISNIDYKEPFWTKNPAEARIYNSIGPARAVVTKSVKRGRPVPVIVELSVGEVREIDERERIEKAVAKRNRDREKYLERLKKESLAEAERKYNEAKARLEELNNDK